jgi:AraC-like DNA-binding protein
MELLKLHIDHLLKNGKLYADGKLDPRVTQETITSEDEKFVAKVTAYIEKNLSDSSLSVEKMGQDLGMSRVKLYRRMVTVTGKTPSEMIRLVRLRHAEQLIRKSQLSVSEIAYRVGFSSHRYFTKCYKDLYGYLPSQYKRGEH